MGRIEEPKLGVDGAAVIGEPADVEPFAATTAMAALLAVDELDVAPLPLVVELLGLRLRVGVLI